MCQDVASESPLVATLLDPPETPQQLDDDLCLQLQQPSYSPAEVFRHTGWRRNRALIFEALKRSGRSINSVLNFSSCGTGAWVLQDPEEPSTYKVAGNDCHDRWCLPCGKYRASKLASAVYDLTVSKQVRFLTLTLKHRAEPLRDSLDRLYKSFAALRRRKFWRSRVKGGGAFCELELSKSDGMWHPHLHCILQGCWIPKQQIREAWYAITKDSYIVDIRLARDHRQVAYYITKYVTKPCTATYIHDQPKLVEAIKALHGRKMCLTFGTWRSVSLTANDEVGNWINVGSFNDLFAAALSGDDDASAIMLAVAPNLIAAARANAERSPPAPRVKTLSPDPQYLLPIERLNHQQA